ncbi:MAG: PLP-dependent aminotransferase family protein [Candidatus Sericytochromatia bacterium]
MTDFRPSFAERTTRVNPSPIREILKLVARPDIISFAGGMPAQDLFPYEAIQAATQRSLGESHALSSLQYGLTEGYAPLRAEIARSLAAEGIHVGPEQVVITTGSQQAIDLVARVLLDPGDEVVVGDPTFLGALQSFSGFEANYLTVPLDEEGMRTDVLANVLATFRPKLIYTIPSFQNPTGISMSDARKAELYKLAREHGVPVLEDDPYGDLYFGETRPTTIRSLDADGETVILCRTFSKVLAPGLRVGYMVMPASIQAHVVPAKQAADLHTGSLNQVLIHEYLAAGGHEAHLVRLREVYRHRRDLMLEAMRAHFPAEVRYQVPEGGLFFWAELPEGVSAADLLDRAVAEQKVAFIPGKPFFADGGGLNTLRLNFSNASEANIEEGIKRLGQVIRQVLKQPTTAV